MLFQVYSDLHIEFDKIYPNIKKEAEILILAGNIGKLSHKPFRNFLEYISKTWEYVIYVLGNHEFYHSKKSIHTLKEEYNIYINYNFKNIFLLDNDYIFLNNYLIFGSTFWSYYNKSFPDNIINCTKKIKMKNEENLCVPIGRDYYNTLHMNDKKELFSNLSKITKNITTNIDSIPISNDTKIIIVTHYPLYNKYVSNPLYDSKKYNSLFQNNKVKELLQLKSVFFPQNNLICISGHTHYSFDFYHKNIRFISNQRGYNYEYKSKLSDFEESGLYYL